MKRKKILCLGGTGAMGVYLVPELLSMGYEVHVAALDGFSLLPLRDPHLTCMQCDVKEETRLRAILQEGYDAIVDFMLYGTKEFKERHTLLLEHTDHYIFLSSYRVYADSPVPITEESPRLLDVSEDEEFLASEDYALYKARQEDILKQSSFSNWTVIRPAITYSKRRFQLTTLEASVVVYRMVHGKKLILPEGALPIQGTMTWAGDVAKMIARLVLNRKAYRDVFTVSTSEHHTWEEIAQMYQKIGGLTYIAVDNETFVNVVAAGSAYARWQLQYDRMFNRVIDNSKILTITGLKQTELMPLCEGLQREITALPSTFDFTRLPGFEANKRIDAYFQD